MDDRQVDSALTRLMLATEALHEIADILKDQSVQVAAQLHVLPDTQHDLRRRREQEEVKFRGSMIALFREQHGQVRAALQPAIRAAWTSLGVLAGAGLLLVAGFGLMIKHQYDRLHEVETRTIDIHLNQQAQQAMQHVDIASCGGRPCIRLRRDTPRWSSDQGEFVLVDGKPAPARGK